MKRIINGKLYNTDTARFIGTAEHGEPGDIYYCVESLYRKKTGVFFLHGDGGSGTRYAVRSGANWAAGEEIIPISPDEARRWIEQNIPDKYEDVFGPVSEEDVSKRIVSFSLPEDVIGLIADLAAEMEISKSDVVEMAVRKISTENLN